MARNYQGGPACAKARNQIDARRREVERREAVLLETKPEALAALTPTCEEMARDPADREIPRSSSELDRAMERLLTYRERRILEYRYELNGVPHKTFDEIAGIFNITRERIRQLENQSLKKLQCASEMQGLRDVLPRRATRTLRKTVLRKSGDDWKQEVVCYRVSEHGEPLPSTNPSPVPRRGQAPLRIKVEPGPAAFRPRCKTCGGGGGSFEEPRIVCPDCEGTGLDWAASTLVKAA